jgi:cyanophycinase
MIPKGTILIIGGAEDRDNNDTDMQVNNKVYEKFEILKELLPKNGRQKRIEIITTASADPEGMKRTYVNAFKNIGFKNVGYMAIQDKLHAKEKQVCERVEKAHAVFFSGGDQFKLAGTLGGTEVIRVLNDKYIHDKDFVVAGTSAGAMALPKIMIYEGGVHEAILKDDIKMAGGLGIFDTCIVDTHFIKRGRFARLSHAIVMNPEALGVGLGEDTALIIKNGFDAECRGSGMVVIIDSREITQTNITEIEDGEPIFVEGLKVHLLVKGCKFSIKHRRMVNSFSEAKAKTKKIMSTVTIG